MCMGFIFEGFPVAQTVKNLPAMRGTWVQSLGWEDTLEEEKATHSSIPAWRIPWTEEPGRLQSMGFIYEYCRAWHDPLSSLEKVALMCSFQLCLMTKFRVCTQFRHQVSGSALWFSSSWLIPGRSPEILTVHAGQVKPYSLLPSFSGWKVALGPCSMPWSQSSQRYQAGPHLHACPCHLIEATEFQRECLQSKEISKGWNHKEGSKGGANKR